MNFCGIKVESNFFLAPMAAITNLPFRLLCKNYGAGLVFTEQINATRIALNPDSFSNSEFEIIKTIESEKPVGVQLFGSNPKDFALAVEVVEKNFDLININCGCPSQKEVSIGAGAALLKSPEKIVSIIEHVKPITEKPLTIKMRLGWSTNEALKIVKEIEKAGADAIIIHGRTALQGYSGFADWNAIKLIKSQTSLPLVANGDVDSGRKAEQLLKETNCEFGMVGRAAMSNPFVFKSINDWFFKGFEFVPSNKEKISLFFEYAKICESLGFNDFQDLKLKAIQFTKGIEFSAKLRSKLSLAKSKEELFSCMEEFLSI
ncbi:MAG: tRNA-dihydrouridine synthase family protein [Candidatus Diapherotrites archaeon]